jgi:hypothetical protein
MKATHPSGNTYHNSLTHKHWLTTVSPQFSDPSHQRLALYASKQHCLIMTPVMSASKHHWPTLVCWQSVLSNSLQVNHLAFLSAAFLLCVTTDIMWLLASVLKWRSDKSVAIFYPCWCLLRHTQARSGIFTSQRDNRALWHASAGPTFLLEDERPFCRFIDSLVWILYSNVWVYFK